MTAADLLRAALSADLARQADLALEILRAGDSDRIVDELIDRQLRAEARFKDHSYAAWDEFPPHPAAGALARHARAKLGEPCDPRWLMGLAALGRVLAEHESDWRGEEELVGSKLRSENNFR